MNIENQFHLIKPAPKPVCKFCWREFHELIAWIAKSGNVSVEDVRQLAVSWVRGNYQNVPLAFYFGLFAVVVNYLFFDLSLLWAVLVGLMVTVITAFLRTIIVTFSYKLLLSEKEAIEIIETIAVESGVNETQVRKYILSKFHELYLWRQFPRGLGLVVASVYTAITLTPYTGVLIGVGLWLITGVLQYRVWKLGHKALPVPTYNFNERRDIWNLFGFIIFPVTFSIPRWVISILALVISMYRINSNHLRVDFSLLFLLFAVNFIISLRNDVV